ncbi:MAG: FAD-dependent monooxygenase [Sandaracinaceae bacterium]|nr:FAD-dependent monooxygenase [Sandaracinaceae bacterium]
MAQNRHDVVVLGAGPAGCAAALTFARAGRSVLLLEADPRKHDRLGAEWLHPTALASLEALGVDLAPPRPFPTGRGWAFHPDDGSAPIVVPYASGSEGAAVQHDVLVETLREQASRATNVTYVPWARATRIEGPNVSYARRTPSGRAEVETVQAELVIGATGRSGAPFSDDETRHVGTAPCSRLVGLVLRDAGELPFEGFQHIVTGGPGPVVLHRLSPSEIRVLLDVPLQLALPSEKGSERALFLEEAYRTMIPASLRPSFREALRAPGVEQAYNAVRPRQGFGRGGALSAGRLALVGDALGYQHPITSLGLVMALRDVEDLAKSASLSEYAERRRSDSRVPEMIAIALYEVLADQAPSTTAVRTAIFRMLREHPEERLRMMALISGQNGSRLAFSRSFAAMLVRGGRDLGLWGARTGRVRETSSLVADIGSRLGWLLGGTMRLTSVVPSTHKGPRTAEEQYGAALRASRAGAEVVGIAATPARAATPKISPAQALERAFRALEHEQDDDGSFEGEVVWCAMLPAQYVLAMHVMGQPIDETRRRRLVLQFERTRDKQGTWGLHELSEPYLFVTTLVYVAARLLGVSADDPLLQPARQMLEREGVLSVPSWGKLWLALVGLWDWEGVNPVLPEAWSLPTSAPIHPSRYYCHTRNIYLAMATLYGERVIGPVTPRIRELRAELFPSGFESVDFAAARESLRAADLWEPPSSALKLVFRASKLYERVLVRKGAHEPGPRQRLLAELRDQIRYEMRSTHHTCISPVSGLLGMIALHAADPADPDVARALSAFEGWVWEDDVDGLRVAGARSASWDTSFALQALSAARPHLGAAADDVIARADEFLASQQVTEATGREAEHFRLDPRGGWCFAGVWHGWPVSDCTAEAVCARLSLSESRMTREEVVRAVQFILRTQCSDGGFGSYEARRVDLPLEWMNPAEMFGDSMTEKSYVECTASCIAALAEVRHKHPSVLPHEIERAIQRAAQCVRSQQKDDGSWVGVWGILHVYGTMFGIRGLLAAGVPPHDPAIRRACAFLRARQKPDGGWGEHFSSIHARRYVEHTSSQYVQTAWAMTALIEAQDPDFAAVERAASFLAGAQSADGSYPRQDPEGLFFHSALLDYVLYRRYFPLWALGLYESRRKERQRSSGARGPAALHP